MITLTQSELMNMNEYDTLTLLDRIEADPDYADDLKKIHKIKDRFENGIEIKFPIEDYIDDLCHTHELLDYVCIRNNPNLKYDTTKFRREIRKRMAEAKQLINDLCVDNDNQYTDKRIEK